MVFSSNQHLVCALKQEGRKKLSKLVMARPASAGETVLQGMVTDDTTRIGISESHKPDFTPLQVSTPTGHIFHIKGRPVGAVEVFLVTDRWRKPLGARRTFPCKPPHGSLRDTRLSSIFAFVTVVQSNKTTSGPFSRRFFVLIVCQSRKSSGAFQRPV